MQGRREGDRDVQHPIGEMFRDVMDELVLEGRPTAHV